ncbi:MAG: C40 family peptidase [Eubacterium sp.]|nr:C40 family peptidase [Eubacterium sp.]
MKIKKISALLGMTVSMFAAGCFVNTTVASADTATAGVSATLSDFVDVSDCSSAGVTAAIQDSISLAANTNAQDSSEESSEPQTVADLCGYDNLGIASVSGSLNVREKASSDSDTVGKMSDGDACEIISEKDGWYKITSGKVEGYVSSDYILTGDEALAAAEENVTTYATVETTTLYAREEASTDSKVYYLLGDGEELTVLKDCGDWIKVEVDNDKVYVAAEYVSISEELPTALTMTEVKYGEGVSDVRVALVNYALQFVGNPYVWGGTSLTNGCDCSGFVLSVYAHYGIGLPHSSSSQAGYGSSISSSEAQPGDLFFYGSGSSISHVAIYIGNGQIVHASNHRDGIKISNAFYRSPICVRSLL